ncbi:MAG: DNA replication/repair protein RecF [Gammaproteobacteria bacterium]
MALIRLDITDFRNLLSIKLEPLPRGFNLIYGKNGSGKTSLLEAIYYLSLGRSFRSSAISRVIRNTADKFALFAHILHRSSQSIPIGVERHKSGDVKIRISGKDVRSTAELADLTPVQLINSNCFNLLEAPGFRRKYLDWGAFYLSQDFIRHWRAFDRALKQRNAALRGQLSRPELDVWTQKLIESAASLDHMREEYVTNLFPLLLKTINELLTIHDLEISYQPGWDNAQSYQDILSQSIDKDRYLGYTQYGPHRADFKINVNKMPAKDILSRGQQKLFVCAMLLAQGTLLHSYTNKRPIYLVDDLPAELDSTSRSNLMSLLSRQEAQVFVTTVEREILDANLIQSPMKMFHVEHGDITEVRC